MKEKCAALISNLCSEYLRHIEHKAQKAAINTCKEKIVKCKDIDVNLSRVLHLNEKTLQHNYK